MVKFIPFDIERVWQNRLEQRCAKGWGDINRERLCGQQQGRLPGAGAALTARSTGPATWPIEN
tara:strand:+ start:807 stop:995 length:189 start_codon:yes stop_codon:yes gene_type:complete